MKDVLLVFLGGGTGSVLRFLISRHLNQIQAFPLGTFIVNVLGSLIIGLVLGLSMRQKVLSPNYTLLLATGFAGGFTTFSAFSYENQFYFKSGEFLHLGIYTISSVIFGFAAVFTGLYLAKNVPI